MWIQLQKISSTAEFIGTANNEISDIMKKHILFFLLISAVRSIAQEPTTLDQQFISSTKVVVLQSYGSTGEKEDLRLDFIDRNAGDKVSVKIENIEEVPCMTNTSIFFINENTGYLLMSGGCYSVDNLIYKTSDSGKSWTKVLDIRNSDFAMNLNTDIFYMFNEKNGIILWKIKSQYLFCSITNDGGNTWQEKQIKIDVSEDINELANIHFSTSGQIILVARKKSLYVTSNADAVVLKSVDFGNSFQLLK